MKLKHTKNGNIKLTLTTDEAEKLRSILMEAGGLHDRSYLSEETAGFGTAAEVDLAEAGVGYQF